MAEESGVCLPLIGRHSLTLVAIIEKHLLFLAEKEFVAPTCECSRCNAPLFIMFRH